jgi:hypothetical protein
MSTRSALATTEDAAAIPPRLPTKVVVVLAADLPPAEAANAAAVLALSAGLGSETLGPEGIDADGLRYGRIDRHPIPVLAADQATLRELHQQALADADRVRVVAFTEVARRARDYDTYLADLRATPTDENAYVGVQLNGARNRVTALTKRLPLFGG